MESKHLFSAGWGTWCVFSDQFCDKEPSSRQTRHLSPYTLIWRLCKSPNSRLTFKVFSGIMNVLVGMKQKCYLCLDCPCHSDCRTWLGIWGYFYPCCFCFSDSLWPHGLQHARLPCPPLSPRVCSNSCPLSWWCYPALSSSAAPFSSCHQSFPASRSFPMTQFSTSGGQSIEASASAPVLSVNIQGYSIMYNTSPDDAKWVAFALKGYFRKALLGFTRKKKKKM